MIWNFGIKAWHELLSKHEPHGMKSFMRFIFMYNVFLPAMLYASFTYTEVHSNMQFTWCLVHLVWSWYMSICYVKCCNEIRVYDKIKGA